MKEPITKFPGLVPIGEVLAKHGVSRATLQRKARLGRLTFYSVTGDRRVYLDAQEVEALFHPKPKLQPA